MERGTGGGQQQQQQHHHHYHTQQQQQHQQQIYYQHPHHTFMTTSNDEHTTSKSSFDNPATKKKPPKLKVISRSMSIAIDNYEGALGGPLDDSSLIVEPAIIHRSASPVAIRSTPPPQTLAIPNTTLRSQHAVGAGSSGAVSPALSARQQQQHLYTFQHMAAQAHQFRHQQSHASSTNSPVSHTVSPILGTGTRGERGERELYHHQQQHHQPNIFLVNSSNVAENVGGTSRSIGGSTSPIQFIDDYILPPASTHHHHQLLQQQQHAATHPLKKSQFRRSDTIDVHPASTFQMKKTHSFHAPHDAETIIDPLLLSAAQPSATTSSRRTSSVRGNFLMPGHSSSKDISRSPSPSRRGARSHRSLHDPSRRPSAKPESVLDSQIRHPSLNDDLMEPLDECVKLLPPTNLSLENELFIESRSRSNSHTKMEDVGLTDVRGTIRKTSGSFEDAALTNTTSSLKKRGDPHSHSSRQHSSHSLELDARPSTSAAAAATAASTHSSLHLHTAATAATAAYHFKRGAQHGRSLYLSPSNLEEVQAHHRPAVLAAAAAFSGTNASATNLKQAKALHSASMRLRNYRETLSATKKSKSFIGDSAYPPPPPVSVTNEFVELTSPHRHNSSRALTSSTTSGGASTIDEIKRSPRPVSLGATAMAMAATTAFMENHEKRPSFERKPSLTYELGDAAFEQVLRPFHHKVTTGIGTRKFSIATSHKNLKKKSLSDETDEDEEADRKRKRIVCIVMTVFLCLVCASVFVVIMSLTHSSSQSHTHSHQHHLTTKKTYTYNRDVPVHYNVRQENERLMKETMDRARFGKNFTDTASSLLAATTSSLATAVTGGTQHQQQQQQQQQILLPQPQQYPLPHLQQIP